MSQCSDSQWLVALSGELNMLPQVLLLVKNNIATGLKKAVWHYYKRPFCVVYDAMRCKASGGDRISVAYGAS